MKKLVRVAVGVGALVGSMVVAGAPAHAAGSCDPATNPPSVNTWYDENGNYRGTRIVLSDTGYYAYQTYVLETFGQDYYQVSQWRRYAGGQFVRQDCEQKPHQPKPDPGQPRVNSGGGGMGVYLPTRGSTFWVSPPRQPIVTVGEVEPL